MIIDRVAPSGPTEHQSQLRATSKKQQEQSVDFLRLSEEFANEYLLDIDAYTQ